jgi:hypothetical protein
MVRVHVRRALSRPTILQRAAHRLLHERAELYLFGGGQLLRPQITFVEVRLVAEAERLWADRRDDCRRLPTAPVPGHSAFEDASLDARECAIGRRGNHPSVRLNLIGDGPSGTRRGFWEFSFKYTTPASKE